MQIFISCTAILRVSGLVAVNDPWRHLLSDLVFWLIAEMANPEALILVAPAARSRNSPGNPTSMPSTPSIPRTISRRSSNDSPAR